MQYNSVLSGGVSEHGDDGLLKLTNPCSVVLKSYGFFFNYGRKNNFLHPRQRLSITTGKPGILQCKKNPRIFLFITFAI